MVFKIALAGSEFTFMYPLWIFYPMQFNVAVLSLNFNVLGFVFIRLLGVLHLTDIEYLYGHGLCTQELFVLLSAVRLRQYPNSKDSNFRCPFFIP